MLVTYLAFSHPLFGSIFPIVVLIFLIEAYFISWKITSWPCPRCGEPFFHRDIMLQQNFFGAIAATRKCAHCGLPWKEAKKIPFAPA